MVVFFCQQPNKPVIIENKTQKAITMLKYIELVKENRPEFEAKVIDISKKLETDPNWLMVIMHSESHLNHKIVNPKGGATGLIQFMPKTAIALGTTTAQLRSMSNVDQLDYVYKFFKPYAGKIKSGIDLYSIAFLPIILNKPDNWVLQTKNLSAETIAKYNPAFDLNKNNEITVKEWKEFVKRKFDKAKIDPQKKSL